MPVAGCCALAKWRWEGREVRIAPDQKERDHNLNSRATFYSVHRLSKLSRFSHNRPVQNRCDRKEERNAVNRRVAKYRFCGLVQVHYFC